MAETPPQQNMRKDGRKPSGFALGLFPSISCSQSLLDSARWLEMGEMAGQNR